MNTRMWYQESWVWFLIAVPMSAVLFGIVMITMATVHRDDLVVDDYYKDGMAINQTLSMVETARRLSVVAQLELAPVLHARIEGVSDSAVALNIYHVASREMDVAMLLIPDQPQGDAPHSQSLAYVLDGEVPALFAQEGVWYIELIGLDDNWKVSSRIQTPLTNLELRP